MAISFLTSLNEQELKAFLKSAISEIMDERVPTSKSNLPDILDVKQAADFLRIKIATLYEKTSKKIIPHSKKGNKLYFSRAELQAWLEEGKVKTTHELESEAMNYIMNKRHRN